MRDKLSIIAPGLWIITMVLALLMFLHISGIAPFFIVIFWVSAILSIAGRDSVLSITTAILVLAMIIITIALPRYIKPDTSLASPLLIISAYVGILLLFLTLLGRSVWVLYAKFRGNNIT